MTSDRLRVGQWQASNVLICENENQEIKITALSRKDKETKWRLNPVSINKKPYKLISYLGVLNLVGNNGDVLVKTTKDRSKIYLNSTEEYSRKLQVFNHSVLTIDLKAIFPEIDLVEEQWEGNYVRM